MRAALALLLVVTSLPAVAARQGRAGTAAPAGPTLLVDTAKGQIEIRLNPADAPKTVEHILGLVAHNFYRGQRVHRVEASLVQFGDPNSRNMSLQNAWGSGGSGSPIGVAEITPKMKHVRGSVGLGYSDSPKFGDSQLYIMKRASPSLDGKYCVLGQVTKGMDVVDKLEVTDPIRNVTLK